MNGKEKSRAYFNAHRKSRLARGGYWRAGWKNAVHLALGQGLLCPQAKKTGPVAEERLIRV